MSHAGAYAAQEPDRTAVVLTETGAGLTEGELEDRSARLANHLREQGVRRGDVVALLTDDDPRAFEVYRAAMRSGLYVTAIKHLSAAEARYVAADSGAAVLIASQSEAGLAQAIVSRGVEARLRLTYGGVVAGFDSYEDAVAAASDGRSAERRTARHRLDAMTGPADPQYRFPMAVATAMDDRHPRSSRP